MYYVGTTGCITCITWLGTRVWKQTSLLQLAGSSPTSDGLRLYCLNQLRSWHWRTFKLGKVRITNAAWLPTGVPTQVTWRAGMCCMTRLPKKTTSKLSKYGGKGIKSKLEAAARICRLEYLAIKLQRPVLNFNSVLSIGSKAFLFPAFPFYIFHIFCRERIQTIKNAFGHQLLLLGSTFNRLAHPLHCLGAMTMSQWSTAVRVCISLALENDRFQSLRKIWNRICIQVAAICGSICRIIQIPIVPGFCRSFPCLGWLPKQSIHAQLVREQLSP